MDSNSQYIGVVGIVRDGQDTAVRETLTAQPLEVAAILSHHGLMNERELGCPDRV